MVGCTEKLDRNMSTEIYKMEKGLPETVKGVVIMYIKMVINMLVNLLLV